MAHVRQQIRDYVADLLVNFIFDRFGIVIQDRFNVNLEVRQSGETGTLYKFRRYALDEEKLPALIVYTTTDISRLATIGQRTMTHDLELRVDIVNKGSSLNIFENIEQFSAELISKVGEASANRLFGVILSVRCRSFLAASTRCDPTPWMRQSCRRQWFTPTANRLRWSA